MVKLNTQRMGMGRRSLFLLGCLVVSVALVRVAAFHSNSFAVPTKALNCESRIDGCVVGRCSTYSCLSQEKFRFNDVHSSGLSMARSPGNKPEKGSKRKRFKESIKKVLSYPKNILKKDREKQEDNTPAIQISNTLNGMGTGVSDGVNGNESRSKIVDQTVETVNGSNLSLESTPLSAPTATLEKATSGRTATSQTDLSGKWKLIASDEFKASYDSYLKDLGQPSLVRSVALSIIGVTSEETIQSNEGRELIVHGRNVISEWNRKLEASSEEAPLILPLVTADKETVKSECWWGDNGRVHHSWLRDVKKYGGGSFESLRYLEDDGDTLVCKSTFHPTDSTREKASVTWRFRRVNEI